MTEKSDEKPFDFRSYFRNNFEKTVGNYLTLSRMYGWARNFAVLFLLLVALSFFSVGIDASFASAFLAFLLLAMVSMLAQMILDSLRTRLRVSDRDILAYHLFEASELLERYNVEGNAEQKIIYSSSALKHLREFSESLDAMLVRGTSRMPLDLPDIRNLRRLCRNAMNRLYPAIQETHKGADVLLTLSSIFALEREYEQLPAVNESLEKSLNPKSFEVEAGIATRFFINPMRSYAVASIMSLIVVSAAALLVVCLFRVPVKGWVIDWAYIADNAATIVLGILAGWAAVLVAIRPQHKKE